MILKWAGCFDPCLPEDKRVITRRVGMTAVFAGLCVMTLPARSVVAVDAQRRWTGTFAEGFEDVDTVEQLFQPDVARWTGIRLRPRNGRNRLEISSRRAHRGRHALRCLAAATTGSAVSTAGLEKGVWRFAEGETIELSEWLYLVGHTHVPGFAMSAIEMPMPGGGWGGLEIIVTDHNELAIERRMLGLPMICQPTKSSVDFPRNRWVQIRLKARLTPQEHGSVELWQNGRKLIDVDHVATAPQQAQSRPEETAETSSRIACGITTASSQTDAELYLDDVTIARE